MAKADLVQQAQLDVGGTHVELRIAVDTGAAVRFIKEVQEVMTTSGTVWDADCKEAFELGLFDVSREDWMANEVVRVLAKWHTAQQYTTQEKMDDALTTISNLAYDYDSEYGLPSHMFAEFSSIITQAIGVTCETRTIEAHHTLEDELTRTFNIERPYDADNTVRVVIGNPGGYPDEIDNHLADILNEL